MTDTNKMRDESRQQFEAWAATHYVLMELSTAFDDGEYVEPDMQYALEAWQASRQAVVVELPELVGITNGEEVDGSVIVPRIDQAYDQAIHECHEAIEAQGLRLGVRK